MTRGSLADNLADEARLTAEQSHTDQVHALRDALQRSEAFLKGTFDQVPIGIAYTDRDGRLTEVNPAYCELLGYTAAELVTKPIGEITFVDDRQMNLSDIQRLWRGEIGSYTLEKRYVRKDQSPVWVRVTAALIRDDAGHPTCAIGFIENIEARKKAELALQQSRHFVEAVIASVPAALLACNAAGEIVLHNPAAAELFAISGTTPADGQSAWLQQADGEMAEADAATSMPRHQRALARALRGETLTDFEMVLAPTASAARTILASTRRIASPSGEFLGAVSVSQDITERKHAEAELEQLQKRLRDASHEAGMAEIATNVLHSVGNVLNSVNVSASVVTEAARKSKSAGLRRVVSLLTEHERDLASFLTTDGKGAQMLVYLAELAQDLETEREATLVELAELQKNIDHIKDVVSMQQDYAKLSGVTETVVLADLVEDSLRLNAGAFSRHGVSIRREFGEVPPINSRKHKILQILVNLLRNAKYACDESSGPEKLVTVSVTGRAGGVRVAVSDTGIGISAENMSRLFSHGFTTRKGGHGFGLHSAALAAKELGGALGAASAGPGQGATFTLDLPLAPPESGHG